MARQCQLSTCAHRGVSEGNAHPSEAGKLYVFATGIVQFGAYF